MFLLIVFLLLSVGMVYVAQDNLSLVPLHIGNYVFSDIPLFYVIIGSILTGLGFAYVIHIVHSIFTRLSIRGKDNKIKQGKGEIAELTKQIHKLELENEELKKEAGDTEPADKNAL